jgi:hypothetical protein
LDGKSFQFGLGIRQFIGEHGEAEKRIPAQFLGDV